MKPDEKALLVRLGSCIRKLRVERGWSQEDLALKSGLHRTYISSLENGERNPTMRSVGSIAKALGIPVRDLFQ